MPHPYLQTILLIERLHRCFLEVVKTEIDRLGIRDINNVQAMILFHMGGDELTVGELTTRGYYLGSNVSYNVKKMVENGYIGQERSPHDRRTVRVSLTKKGLELRDKLGHMFDRHIEALEEIRMADTNVDDLNDMMIRLERFWSSRTGFPLVGGLVSAA